MSSHVVDKFAYIRAAGIVSGIVEAYSNDRYREIFIFDYEAGHKMATEDFYRRFVQCFEMNCLSVQEQYHDKEPFVDSCEYLDVFLEYIAKGRKIAKEAYYNAEVMREMIFNLQRFFDSCLYQVEKYAYLFNMKSFFYEILVNLWGTLDMEENRVNKAFDVFEAYTDK